MTAIHNVHCAVSWIILLINMKKNLPKQHRDTPSSLSCLTIYQRFLVPQYHDFDYDISHADVYCNNELEICLMLLPFWLPLISASNHCDLLLHSLFNWLPPYSKHSEVCCYVTSLLIFLWIDAPLTQCCYRLGPHAVVIAFATKPTFLHHIPVIYYQIFHVVTCWELHILCFSQLNRIHTGLTSW